MNVNLLENNPTWLWYLLFAGVVFTLTMFGWLLFKFIKVSSTSLSRAREKIKS